MSLSISLLTRGMVAETEIVPQPYTAESPKIPTIVHVKPKIRSAGATTPDKPTIKSVK